MWVRIPDCPAAVSCPYHGASTNVTDILGKTLVSDNEVRRPAMMESRLLISGVRNQAKKQNIFKRHGKTLAFGNVMACDVRCGSVAARIIIVCCKKETGCQQCQVA